MASSHRYSCALLLGGTSYEAPRERGRFSSVCSWSLEWGSVYWVLSGWFCAAIFHITGHSTMFLMTWKTDYHQSTLLFLKLRSVHQRTFPRLGWPFCRGCWKQRISTTPSLTSCYTISANSKCSFRLSIRLSCYIGWSEDLHYLVMRYGVDGLIAKLIICSWHIPRDKKATNAHRLHLQVPN